MKGEIAYFKLYSFNSNASRLLFESSVTALAKGTRGIVLDVRNNPGGFLDVAVQLAGFFFPRGTLIVSEEGVNRPAEKFLSMGSGPLSEIPIVVLVNGGSASASEILAGALRDNRKAKLIGEQSFGKGTVQEIVDLSDGSSLKLTIAHWVLPSGEVLEGAGLKPDIEVKLTDEDAEAERDPQLEKALEVLRAEIAAR